MKLFTQYINQDNLYNSLVDFKDLDLSIFHQIPPTSQEQLSKFNIIAVIEPNEYFGLNDWIIKNQDLFDVIITWDDKILNNCNRAVFNPFGNTTFIPEQYNRKYNKKFEIAHLCGNLLKSHNHSMRHEIMARKNEFKCPINFYQTIGSKDNTYIDEEDRRNGKQIVFSNSMFGIAIENFSHRGYFSEKILDCFLMRTIPIYCGCSNIDDFFNTEGIILSNNTDDIIHQCNNLTEEFYINKTNIIEENYQLALKYCNYEKTIINLLKHTINEFK